MNLFGNSKLMFQNFDDMVRSYLAKTFNNLGMQYTHSQIFGMIFDGIGGIMTNALFYIEDALNEQNIYKATRKQSVYSLARLSGYEPYYGSAACGTLIGKLRISNDLDSKTTKIYIKNHTQIFERSTGAIFSVQLPTEYYVFDVSKPLVNHEFKIVQGEFNTATFTASGNPLETFNIDSFRLFDKEYLTVKVNGEEWMQVSNLYDMTERGKQYIFDVGFDNKFSITFGNGIHGKLLTSGDSVTIEYLNHTGNGGNVTAEADSLFVWADTGTDVFNNKIELNNYISLSLLNCVSGGTNADSIEFVRTMIGKNSRSLVLASSDNFELFFKRFSFVGTVNCWSENNSMYVIASCTQNKFANITAPEDYYNLTESSILLTNEQKNMIKNTLDNSKKTFAGVSLKFEDPIIRKFALICYVKLFNIYDRDLVKNNINKFVSIYFLTKINNTQFIAKSDIIKYLLTMIPQIKSLDITILSGIYEEAFKNSYYYEYIYKEINGGYSYIRKKVMYEKDITPGLDEFGNISLNSKLEIPVIFNNFRYYIDKSSNKLNTSTNCVIMDGVQVYFT